MTNKLPKHRFNNRLLKALVEKHKVKLNIGCGTDYKDGWINIDNNSDNNIEKLDLNWDLRTPLPFHDDSIDFIFNEHFIEHLSVEESKNAIKDFMRTLKPGGVLRIAMPDLEAVVQMYNDPEWENKPFIRRFNLEFVKTRAEMLNMNFSWWGHKWLYDWEELDRRLKDLGCNNVKKCKLGQSKHKELQNLETRKESTLIAEVSK